MKKTLTLILALAMLLAMFAGCSKTTAEPTTEPETTQEAEAPAQSETAEPEPEAEPEAEAGPEAEAEPEVAEPVEETSDGIDLAAHKELVKSLTADFPIADGEELSVWLSYETSSLQYVDGGEMNDIVCYEMLEELTGVHLDIVMVDMTTSSEKFNIMVASSDFTDLLPTSSYSTGGDAAIDDEVVIDLTDLIDEYCPNFKTLLDSSSIIYDGCTTTEGRIAAFSRIKDGVTTPGNAGAFMRRDWLEDLGMDVPATYDELEEVLLAFKTEKGATEPLMLGDTIIPMGGNLTAGYDFTAEVSLGQGGGGGGAGGFFQKDGTVIYGALTEEFKDFTKMLNRWYSEGLISEKCLTRATNPFSSDIIDPVLNGDTGMFYSNQPFGDNYNERDETGTIDFYPVRDVGMTADQQLHFYEELTMTSSGDLGISTTCRDEVLSARYLDSLYSYECFLIINYGRQGETWDFDENGEPQFLQSALDQFVSTNIAMAVWTTQSLPSVYAESRLQFTFGEGAAAAYEVWSTNKDNAYGIGSKYSLTSSESEAISTISTDILTYIAEHYWKFVTGEEDIDAQWDEYVATIESMGYQTMYETVQAAYDRAYK